MGSASSLAGCRPVRCGGNRCPDPCMREDAPEEGLRQRRDGTGGGTAPVGIAVAGTELSWLPAPSSGCQVGCWFSPIHYPSSEGVPMPTDPEVSRSRRDGVSVRTWAGAAGWGPGSRCDKEGPWAAGGGAAEPCPDLKAPAAFRGVHFARSMCHPPPERPLRFGTVLPICVTCHGRMPCKNVRVAFSCACCLLRGCWAWLPSCVAARLG